MEVMESAIPRALQCPRTRQRRIAEDYVPPFPAVVARFEPNVKRVVMAYMGIQYPESSVPAGLHHVQSRLHESLNAENAPGHQERARYVDEAGFVNIVTIAYWDDSDEFDRWFALHGAGWARGAVAEPGIGTFSEILRPSIERFETLFSSDIPEGVATVSQGWSGMIQEHAYWGGMRDRIPMSQTHHMEPEGEPRVVADGRHRRVEPHHNLCLIRSGQDWTATDGEERRMYTEDVEPVLHAGMTFLRDDGRDIGCFANRYMTLLDSHGRAIEKSFGMSWWKSLAALERWAESHPTHVAIFGAAMKYLGTLGPAARLRLYHEVTVASRDEQFFEYFNCHAQTGMLRCAE